MSDEITLTIYTSDTGLDIARTLVRYGVDITDHEWDDAGSEIVVECKEGDLDSVEEYLDANEDVIDYSTLR